MARVSVLSNYRVLACVGIIDTRGASRRAVFETWDSRSRGPFGSAQDDKCTRSRGEEVSLRASGDSRLICAYPEAYVWASKLGRPAGTYTNYSRFPSAEALGYTGSPLRGWLIGMGSLPLKNFLAFNFWLRDH